ncbi:DNA polymerase III subunit beta [Novosphingobium sp. AP12]|uniref:DNA polymerase III subunit beta n=1 Tax=Novosphingobium sp. AP12 TaxID=1144305 RepID=UPI0002720ADF|nr:DNA polymerase III subunit beta [Novosphingobium sp. AP12]EJL25588.1 DNA polymerase III, beta subunit [Novosphingobium sp. AP12]
MATKRSPKTRVQASVLLGALKDVLEIIEARNTIPVLSHVLIEVEDQQLTVMASDLDQWATRNCATADRDGPDSREWLTSLQAFSVCLPAKKLAAVLTELDSEAMVRIEVPSAWSKEWSGQATVSAGAARFKLNALPVTEFPAPPPIDLDGFFELPCSQLGDVLAAVKHAISTEETRYYLNGVFMHPVDLDLRFATTDGHRLARLRMDGPVGSTSYPAVIVARKTVAVLEKLLAHADKAAKGSEGEPPVVLIECNATGSRLQFTMPTEGDGEVTLIAKTIDGEFPDYGRVIPSDPKERVTVARSSLAAVVKRVAVMAEGETRIVKFAFDEDRLTVSARSIDVGEASEDLACEYRGPAFELGFNSKYLLAALGAIASDVVALRCDGDGASAVRIAGWEDEDEVGALLQVLMPARV